MKTHEVFAVVIGGLGLAFAVFLAIMEAVREDLGVFAVPVVGVILWREYVFTGIRKELARFRRNGAQNSN